MYGATSTTIVSSTARQTKTLTPSTTTTKTATEGTAHSTVFTTATDTVSSAFGTETGERALLRLIIQKDDSNLSTDYSFDLITKTRFA